MSVPKSPKPPISRKSVILQALFVIGILLLGRFLWMRERPEHLPDPPGGLSMLGVFGEERYLFTGGTRSQAVLTLMVQPLHGGPPHVICQERAGWSLYPSFTTDDGSAAVVKGMLYYAILPRANVPVLGTGPFSGGKETILPTFLLQSQNADDPTVAGQERTKWPPRALSGWGIKFQQVAAQGGMPREAAAIQGNIFSMIGDHVFWIKPAKEEMVEVTQGRRKQDRVTWMEVSAHSDLMLTSLADGKTRRIRQGIPYITSLKKGVAGVTWEEPAPYPTPPSVFYARASDGTVHSMGTRTAENRFASAYQECGDRLYWTQLSDPKSPSGNVLLMSVHSDGTDTRVVCSEVNHQPISHLQLSAYEDNLYGYIYQMGVKFPTLLRLHSDRPDPVETLCKLPGLTSGTWFEGGFLYFYLQEEQSLWGGLANDNVSRRYIGNLCRVPLKH